jgi:hypothetical protein
MKRTVHRMEVRPFGGLEAAEVVVGKVMAA